MDKVSENEKYLKVLDELDSLNDQLRNMHTYYDSTVQEMKSKYNEKWSKANEIRDSFSQFKREIAKASENSKTGKPLSEKASRSNQQMNRFLTLTSRGCRSMNKMS